MNILILGLILLLLLGGVALIFILLMLAGRRNTQRAIDKREAMEANLAQSTLASGELISPNFSGARLSDE